jgi:hypothetical protein
MYICVYIYIYTYIYLEREREKALEMKIKWALIQQIIYEKIYVCSKNNNMSIFLYKNLTKYACIYI